MEAHAMKSITQDNHQTKCLSAKSMRFFQQYRIAKILHAANANKIKGIPAMQIFLLAVSIVFQHKSLYMQMNLHPDTLPFGKDTFYRFMNSCHTNWRKFTTLLSFSIIRHSIEPLTDEKRRNVLIIDDSIFNRSRSKKVELLAKVFDHAHGLYTFGFRMLTLGWSDGNTFLPVSHCLLSTANQKNRINEASAKVDPRTNGGSQRKLAQLKATDVVLQLLKETKATGISAQHVLFDTWFCAPASLTAIKDIGFDVIAMAKKTSKMHYRYQGKMQDVKAIYQQNTKRRGRAKYLLSVEAEAVKDGKAIPVRFVYVHNRNRRKDYLVLVTTDMSLGEEEVISLYGRRWGIEVFFKICKSYLHLSKDCRSISYDAMTAHVAVVFTRYMLLAVEQRESQDLRSIGELFYLTIDELPDLQFLDALHLLLLQFAELVQKNCLLSEQAVQLMLDSFLQELPSLWAESLPKCS